MTVEIDDKSGFCFGVVNAITLAERSLQSLSKVWSLGDIVHNRVEMERLAKLGLGTIRHDELDRIGGGAVLIRAHGEPPATYETAAKNGLTIIDATCPVVAKLQERVAAAYERMLPVGGQVVIFGKKGHAEVVGLTGQVDRLSVPTGSGTAPAGNMAGNEYAITKDGVGGGDGACSGGGNGGRAICAPQYGNAPCSADVSESVGKSRVSVVEGLEDLDTLDFGRPIYFLSQTTQSLALFEEMGREILRRAHDPGAVTVNDTICRQVANREPHLKEFASKYDVVVFVCGRKSSNGQALFAVCVAANPRSYMVEDETELCGEWFDGVSRVGICGATSTPMWIMERVAERIRIVAHG